MSKNAQLLEQAAKLSVNKAAFDVHTGILITVRRLAHAIMATMPRNPGKP
jgi:hypothetical protein